MATRSIALDIGSRFIKAVSLASRSEDEVVLDVYGMVRLPDKTMNLTFSDRPFANLPAAKEKLKELVAKTGTKGSYAFITIPDNLVVINWITMAVKAQDAVEKSIGPSLAPLLPLEIDRWYYDFQIIEVSKKQTTVIAEAVLKSNLEEIGNLVTECGLIPCGLDSTFFNLMNVYHAYLAKTDNEKKNICLIYMGHQATTVAFFKGGLLKSSRVIQSGGMHFTSLIMEKRNINDEEAEKLKFEQEVFVRDNPDKQNKNEIYNIIKPAFGDLIKSIYNSVDQYLARFREFKIHEIILSGGCGSFKNLDAALQANLNTKTILGTEITRMSSKDGKLPEEDKHLYTCAVGALMRGE